MSAKDDEPEVTSDAESEDEEIVGSVAEDGGNEIAMAEQEAPGDGSVDPRSVLSAETAVPEEVRMNGGSEAGAEYAENIQRILDIQLPVTVSFGSASRSLEDVLKMSPGSLIELETSAEEPVMLKVNNKAFAWGKVVDVDGYYGVEITEIVGQADRIATLGGH
jgi:flagellar motor switch protein FliN